MAYPAVDPSHPDYPRTWQPQEWERRRQVMKDWRPVVAYDLPTLEDLDPFERRVSGVLGRYGLAHGVYHEDEDGADWLAYEAIDVAHCLETGMDPFSVLYGTGFIDGFNDDGGDLDALRADLHALTGLQVSSTDRNRS